MNIDLPMDEHEIYRITDALQNFDSTIQNKYSYRFSFDADTIASMEKSDHVLWTSLETEKRSYRRWGRLLPWTESEPVTYSKPRTTDYRWDVNKFALRWFSLHTSEDDLAIFKRFCEVYAIDVRHIEAIQESTHKIYHPMKTEFSLNQIIYHSLFLIYPYTKHKYQELHIARQRKLLFEIAKPFYTKVNNNPIIDDIVEQLFNISISSGITKVAFHVSKYYIGNGIDSSKSVKFTDLGFKNLPSLDACCGLGFAVAQRVVRQVFRVNLDDCSQSNQIDVFAIRGNPPYDGRIEFLIHEAPKEKKDGSPKPLQDW